MFAGVLAIVGVVVLMELRNWLYHGGGRWVGVPVQNNVVRVQFGAESK